MLENAKLSGCYRNKRKIYANLLEARRPPVEIYSVGIPELYITVYNGNTVKNPVNSARSVTRCSA